MNNNVNFVLNLESIARCGRDFTLVMHFISEKMWYFANYFAVYNFENSNYTILICLQHESRSKFCIHSLYAFFSSSFPHNNRPNNNSKRKRLNPSIRRRYLHFISPLFRSIFSPSQVYPPCESVLRWELCDVACYYWRFMEINYWNLPLYWHIGVSKVMFDVSLINLVFFVYFENYCNLNFIR